MDTAPNSRGSLLAAFASEADIVEVDLRGTLDGVVVLAHDEGIPVPGRGNVPVRELRWDEIVSHTAAEASPMLSLEDFAGIARESGRGRMINLDIKENSVLDAAARLVTAQGLADSVIFSGLEMEGIKLARERLSGLSYFFNADGLMPAAGAAPREIEAACDSALEYGCCGINLEWTRATEFSVACARSRGLLVMLWTVDTEIGMRTALDFRPDSITTNYPDLLARIIGSQVASRDGRGPSAAIIV